jgi:hypothetical protein
MDGDDHSVAILSMLDVVDVAILICVLRREDLIEMWRWETGDRRLQIVVELELLDVDLVERTWSPIPSALSAILSL